MNVTRISSTAGAGYIMNLEKWRPLLDTTSYAEGRAWCEAHPEEIAGGYAPSKEVVILWTMKAAWDLQKRGIRVNCVSPGPTQTPMMAGFIRQAILNPYWQVPDDLVQNSIAANVLNQGVRYLKNGGYQVFTDWSEKEQLDPNEVDWHAVREGRKKVHVRQLPGGSNFMGKVKFEFPNAQGIYLHDTPDKQLLRLDQRQLSSGCVRLEDAPRLGR